MITVITATFNSSRTLSATLASAAAQVEADFEHLVVDGGSTDETLAIVNSSLAGCAVVSEPDDGIYDALNKGMRLAKGDIIGILHSDDEFADAYVLRDVAQMFDNPHTQMVYGDLRYVNAVGEQVRYWRSGRYRRAMLAQGWMPPHPTVFVRRKLIDRVGKYDMSYSIASDYDYLIRLLGACEDTEVKYLGRVLVNMKMGGVSNSGFMNLVSKSREDYLIIRRQGIGGLWTLFRKNFSKLRQFFG